jgi:nucleoside phosphorylase
MRVLVTFAVEAEFAPWRKRHRFARNQIKIPRLAQNEPFSEVYEGGVAGTDVDVLLTGIGWQDMSGYIAKKVFRELLRRKPDSCISTGLAGGLNAQFRPGEIVAASELVFRGGGNKMYSNRRLLKVAETCGAKIAKTLITESHIVSEASAKSAMSKFGDFVDMESYHILQIVSGTQIPAIAVRGISDAANEDLPLDFNRIIGHDGTVRKGQLIGELARSPQKISRLIRFGWRSRKAAYSLADFLDRFITSFVEYDGRVAAAAYGEVAAR